MKSFEVNGKSYDSMSEFCKKFGFSYNKMRRLCRIYERAKKDPAIAARWLLNLDKLNKNSEPKTFIYIQEKELNAARQVIFRARKKAKRKKKLAKIMGLR